MNVDEISEDSMSSRARNDREQMNSSYVFFKAIDNHICAREYRKLGLEITILMNPQQYNLQFKKLNRQRDKRM